LKGINLAYDINTYSPVGPRYHQCYYGGAPFVPDLRVAVRPVGSSQFRLSWPTDATNYVLETTSTVPTTQWTLVTNAPGSAQGYFELTLDRAPAQRFFRLRKP
jgi:hypothetical protein